MSYDDVNVFFFLKKSYVGVANVVLLFLCKIVIVTIFIENIDLKKVFYTTLQGIQTKNTLANGCSHLLRCTSETTRGFINKYTSKEDHIKGRKALRSPKNSC